MKAKFKTADLRNALNRLTHIPGGRHGLPLVKLTADMEGFSIVRNTPNARIALSVENEMEEDGECIVGMDHFLLLATKIETEELSLFVEGEKLHVHAGKGKWQLTILPETEIGPEFVGMGKVSAEVNLPMEEIVEKLKTAATARSLMDADGVTTAVSLRTNEGALNITATDKRRFLMLPIAGVEETVDVMIPGEAVESIAKAFGDVSGACSLSFFENGMAVTCEGGMAIYALQAGQYQNVAPIVKTIDSAEVLAKVKVNRAALISAIDAAKGFSDKDDTISLEIGKDTLRIVGDNRNSARAEQEVDAKCKKYEPVEVNANYLSDAAKAMREDEITFQIVLFNPKVNGRVITLKEDDRMGFVCLIVPPPKN